MNRIKNSLVASGGLSLLIVLLGVAPAAAGPKNSQVAFGTTESDNKFTWVVDVQERLQRRPDRSEVGAYCCALHPQPLERC